MSEDQPNSHSTANDVNLDNEAPSHHNHVAFSSSAYANNDAPPPSTMRKNNHNAPSSTTSVRRLSSPKMLDPARPRRLSSVPREAHMDALIAARRESMKCLFPLDAAADDLVHHQQHRDGGNDEEEEEEQQPVISKSRRKSALEQQSEFVRKLRSLESTTAPTDTSSRRTPMEIRLKNVTFQVPLPETGDKKIHTIYNSSPLYKIQKMIQRGVSRDTTSSSGGGGEEYTNVLTDVNLVLKPTKMYLILGPPLSGKTSLLKAIGGMLSASTSTNKKRQTAKLSGSIRYNNLDVSDKKHTELIENLVAFVRQHDSHAPRLTVDETFTFARNCKDGGAGADDDKNVRRGGNRVASTLEALGLAYVKDTFVGDEAVRGVSGGQRRRVTLGEMLVFDTPLLCGDEISTGLDTASTIDILSILSYMTRLFHRVTVVSLLQPSPEAVALFDEIILLGDGGTVLFTGPTEDAAEYFSQLGYKQPDGMDSADYLLAVASSDRHMLRQTEEENEASGVQDDMRTSQKLGEMFGNSEHSSAIARSQGMKWSVDWNNEEEKSSMNGFDKKYQNSFATSVWLNFKRSFILWTRDRVFIRASVIKNLAMGITVGAVFFDTNLNSSFFGILFQGNLFIMLGAMASAPEKLNDREIFYKHDDSNFYPAASYVIGQALALVPQMMIDVLIFGCIVYWMVGFTPTAGGFILYLVLFFSFNFACGQLFGLLAAVAPSKAVCQAGGALLLLLNTLFCGFIVAPSVIPPYYIWIYWCMPLAWVYRALLLNEYTSAEYEGGGEQILEAFGFMHKGEAFTREWIGYCFTYLVPFVIICMISSAICLHYKRVEPKRSSKQDLPESKETNEEEKVSKLTQTSSFIPVTLAFSNLSYEVKSSVGGEQIKLLNSVSGMFSPGRMCALMGESGAGKTTLMDVIALRKQSGHITGEITINGFPQVPQSFRRCSGYVEQFDVQSAELTVRETITFSAQLRLEQSDPVFATADGLKDHVSLIIDMLELTNEADILVGSAEEEGLTFEQKKRLSIAAELAASPSIVFLDEPTSGLDARAALLVMNALRRIANTGRTVVATIHQPSSTVFDMFDDLLLLKKGGEVVYFGELGDCSCNLVDYFESLGSNKINSGENPATWMLNVLAEKITVKSENGQEAPLEFAYAWSHSEHSKMLQERLTEIAETKDKALEIVFETEYAASKSQRNKLMANRLVTIYWRSPAYNLSRMLLSLFIALLLSTMFIPIRQNNVFSEAEIASYLSTIFIAFIIIGVLSITSVLPVMLNVRDMFYRHKAAQMLESSSVGRALATAEKRFIIIASFLFCVVFVPVSGIMGGETDRRIAGQSFAFWGFFTFNMAIYSYSGQLFMCLVRGPATAQILCAMFIGTNNFFSGLIVRPQQMGTGLWLVTYWITPGHFVYEGMVTSIFYNDDRQVIVESGSDLWTPLNCTSIAEVDGQCDVSVNKYVDAFYGGHFSRDNVMRNAIILGVILIVVRASTFVALKKLSYTGK